MQVRYIPRNHVAIVVGVITIIIVVFAAAIRLAIFSQAHNCIITEYSFSDRQADGAPREIRRLSPRITRTAPADSSKRLSTASQQHALERVLLSRSQGPWRSRRMR